MTCPLCAKLQRLHDLPDGELVWQFPHSIAFLGPWQYHTGYCVLVARTHAAELYELPLEVRRGFFDEMCLLAQAIAACFQPRKMNYEALGNQVAHLHWHLFPRRHDDPETLQAVWLGFDRATRDEAEKERLQKSGLSIPEISRRIAAKVRELS
jgi:diadenosine tetraphosphate (Ap4A) HIT family hydrolase